MTRPFVDRPITDRAAADRAATEAAHHWGLDEPRLLRVGMNAIYVAGDSGGECVLRVSAPSAPAESALELSTSLAEHGLRVPQPRRLSSFVAGELAVTCWERIVPSGVATDWRRVGEMVRAVHSLTREQLPAAYPIGAPASFAWWDFDAMLGDVGGDIDEQARAGLVTAVEAHPRWEDFDEVVVCHGDVHPGNVMMAADGPVLIDWDLLCAAPRGWDHGPMMTWRERWGGPVGDYEEFADGYGESLRGDPEAEAFAELRLVAATLMRVKAARADPSARAEADRRLRYWRGDLDAPPWTAQ